jgi:ubiquinone/menaquinone biosynthesis C-methylase UbiE
MALNWQEWFQEAVSESGDSIAASRYDSVRSFRLQQGLILNRLGPVKGRRILDVGPATGHFAEALTAHNTVIGIDFVADMLGFAAQKGLLPVQGDGLALPFPDQSMDVVICVGVLQHISQPEAFLRELLRVKKPGGQVFLLTLNQQSLVRWLYYKLTPHTEMMHTYRLGDLLALCQRLAPGDQVEGACVYYPLPLGRWLGPRPGLSRYLSTAIAVRVF